MFKVFALQGKRIVRNIYNVLDLDQTVVANLKVPVSAKDGKSIFSIQKGIAGTAKETSREGKKIGTWLNNTEAFEEANKIMLFMDQATMQRVATLYSAEFQNMYTKGFQRFFFRANLLSEWTRTVELAAFLMGKDMIKTNLTKINKGGYATGTIKRYKDELAELGIKDNLLADGIKYIQGKGSAKQRQLFEEEITKSGGRFAREVILNPKVNQETALWLQNPHTAIFTQLLAYPFAFGNTVTKRFAQGMFKGPTNAARTTIAGSLMTMTGIIGNEWRTGGGRLPTPYDPTAKTMDYEHQAWHDVLVQGIRRWGGFGYSEFLSNIERNLRYSSWGDRKRPLDATKGLLGPLGGDLVDVLTGKRTVKQAAIEKLPGFTAYPKEIQAKLRQAAKEEKVLDQETIQWIFGYIDGLNREEELMREIEEQKWERERVQKFKGGTLSEDYPVPNVNLVPSERVDKNTGFTYEEPFKPSTLLSEALKTRKAKRDGGLMVSIGITPVSEKQISKLTKSLKKRKAKREGGEIRQRYAFGDRIRKALQRRGEGEIANIEGFKEPRLPSNMRQFVYDLAGGDKTFTEKDLQQDELKAMQELVSNNLKNNKYEISFADYGTAPDPAGLSDVGGKDIKNVSNPEFLSRLKDPRYSMKTTVGAANITVDENDDVFVIDQYNYNDNPLNPTTPQEDSSFISDALKRRGNVYGQLRNVGKHFGSPEGEGSPIVLNLGKRQDLP